MYTSIPIKNTRFLLINGSELTFQYPVCPIISYIAKRWHWIIIISSYWYLHISNYVSISLINFKPFSIFLYIIIIYKVLIIYIKCISIAPTSCVDDPTRRSFSDIFFPCLLLRATNFFCSFFFLFLHVVSFYAALDFVVEFPNGLPKRVSVKRSYKTDYTSFLIFCWGFPAGFSIYDSTVECRFTIIN